MVVIDAYYRQKTIIYCYYCNFSGYTTIVELHINKPIFLLLPLYYVALGGCATPSIQFDRYATQFEFQKSVVTGRSFKHAIYSRNLESKDGEPLHVYLGSDGTPWLDNKPAFDPTPRNRLTLRLMLADDKPAVYVGRPCYHGLNVDLRCNEQLWTSARYSEVVIQSIVAVIKEISASSRHNSIVLIGYSGGGVIAALAAQRIENVTTLITIAANLDIDAWTDHHGYEPLHDSINPAYQRPLRPTVAQYHLFGSDDLVVPSEVVNRFFDQNADATHREISGFDHRCCWVASWPGILGEITSHYHSTSNVSSDTRH